MGQSNRERVRQDRRDTGTRLKPTHHHLPRPTKDPRRAPTGSAGRAAVIPSERFSSRPPPDELNDANQDLMKDRG